MESEIKKIIIKTKVNNKNNYKNKNNKNIKNNNKKITQLENCIEIKQKNIKYFYGTWVKAIHNKTGEYYSGGFLMQILQDILFLRNSHNIELLSFNMDNFTFYVKKDSEQYIAMQNIELKQEEINLHLKQIKSKLKNIQEREKELINKENETIKFEKIKNKFFKLFEEGKVKILV